MKILVLDPDKANLVKCKSFLSQLEDVELLCTCFPEQALEWINDNEIGIMISEYATDIMNAEELFDIMSISHPDTLLMLMTEVNDAIDVLPLVNRVPIFKIILKPLQFAEDIIVPVKTAIEYYKERRSADDYTEKSADNAQKISSEVDVLRNENRKRSKDYSILYSAFSGIVEANLLSYASKTGLSESDCDRVKAFIQNITKEYVNTYIFVDDGTQSYLDKLIANFENPVTECSLKIKNNVGDKISHQRMQDIYFNIYMMALLCKTTLSKYSIEVVIESQEQFIICKIVCNLDYSKLDGKILFSEENAQIRNLMHEVIAECLKKLFTKSVKGYKDNPYVSVCMMVKES